MHCTIGGRKLGWNGAVQSTVGSLLQIITIPLEGIQGVGGDVAVLDALIIVGNSSLEGPSTMTDVVTARDFTSAVHSGFAVNVNNGGFAKVLV